MDEALEKFTGTIIAIVHRNNDVDMSVVEIEMRVSDMEGYKDIIFLII